MADLETRKAIGKSWENDENDRRESNKILSDLYEGCICKYVKLRIKHEIIDRDEQKEMAARILEVNITRRVVSKISKAYKDEPIRRIVDGNDKDNEMIDWYLNNTNIKKVFQNIDKSFNNYKESLVRCLFHTGSQLPYFKVLEPYEYIVYSTDMQDRTVPTIIAIGYGVSDTKEQLLLCISKDEIWLQNLKGDLYPIPENNDGYNLYSEMPFVYLKNTESMLMPYPDESLISVSTLIPMLCGDINYAIKYMSYGIVWGANIKEDLIRRGPNAFWNLLPFDENSTVTPQVGTLKPDVDIGQVFDGIMKQLQFWLNARGLTASTLGVGSGDVASGISKMIDEADVSALVEENQKRYSDMEKNLFNFIMHFGHDVWKVNNPAIPQDSFSPACFVETTFPKVEPLKARKEVIDELTGEIDKGLISVKKAIKRLNPNMLDEDIDSLVVEIDEDKKKLAALNPQPSYGFNRNF